MKRYYPEIFLALILYAQNIVFSFYAPFVFIPSSLEFVLILSIIVLLSYFRFQKYIISMWLLLYFIQFSFISYFAEPMLSSDIYLFFTHVVDSYETFIYTLDIYIVAFCIFIFMLLLLYKIELIKRVFNIYILLLLLFIIFLINFTKLNDASFLLLKSIYQTNSLKIEEINREKRYSKEKKPFTESEVNIILLIGESMRAKEFHEDTYEIFERDFYKTIYSGGTSTDVSIPLLLNGAIKPSLIDNSDNMFRLAKDNSYLTQFITTQSEKNMRYIQPYMDRDSIDIYRVLSSRRDSELLDALKKIDLDDDKIDFVVMQMQGQHSPYIYYPEYKKSTISEQYAKSMEYSNTLILEMMEYVKNSKKESLFIFTSDHGELLGENSRFGHNRFKEQVYRVPMVIADSLKQKLDYEKLESHRDIYQLIEYLLGYKKELEIEKNNIRVNGSMMSEEDGYRIFKISK